MNETSVTKSKISVFLLDDHEIFRRGLRDLLNDEPDMDVIGEAGTVQEALAQIRALRPDVAVLDVRLPDGDGVLVCREIRSDQPDTACLILTSFNDDQALLGAIMAGAAGYVLKEAAGAFLVNAVRSAAAGHSTLDVREALKVIHRLRDQMAAADPLSALSQPEKQVLELIGKGLTDRQIAQRMYLPEKIVKDHVASQLTKLGMRRRRQATAYATLLARKPAPGQPG